MQRLFRDRMEYISSAGQDGCFLCSAWQTDVPDDLLVLARGEYSFVILNKYPYNSGHLMVATARHGVDLDDLSDEESRSLMRHVTACVDALKKQMHPEGFNIGANLGSAAGAGVPDHLHLHVVPRWPGDTNFMPVVGDAKVVPEILTETFKRLKPYFST